MPNNKTNDNSCKKTQGNKKVINILSKESARANHILNTASAVKINKEITPTLFSLNRLSLVTLNSFTFGCEVWKATKFGLVSKGGLSQTFKR